MFFPPSSLTNTHSYSFTSWSTPFLSLAKRNGFLGNDNKIEYCVITHNNIKIGTLQLNQKIEKCLKRSYINRGPLIFTLGNPIKIPTGSHNIYSQVLVETHLGAVQAISTSVNSCEFCSWLFRRPCFMVGVQQLSGSYVLSASSSTRCLEPQWEVIDRKRPFRMECSNVTLQAV